MSEFDKEAEREKLRQKFAKEEEDRKSTQRMSELLLQGATMTNSHCNTCGDPIFRYDGNEFCPSCQAAGQQAAAQQTSAQQESGQSASPDTTEQSRALHAETEATERDTDAEPTAADLGSATQPEPRTGTGRASGSSTHPHSQGEATAPSLSGDFGDAEVDIAQTIRYFSGLAANTDDPARARDCLETVREAADTLAALRD